MAQISKSGIGRSNSRSFRGRGRGYYAIAFLGLYMIVNFISTWCAGTDLILDENEQQRVAQGNVKASRKQQGRIESSTKPEKQNWWRPKAMVDYDMPERDSSANTAGFIHIGKTGGSTISNLLRNGCNSFVQGPCRSNITDETVVSKLVEHYYHVPDFHRLPKTKHKAFIVSVRDPYVRTVSAFLYHHPENAKVYNHFQTQAQQFNGPIAYKCFPTLEDFAALMRSSSVECNYPYSHREVVNADCTELACAVIHGKVRFFHHLFFNYRNIVYEKMPRVPPRVIYVIRQEKLWDDWKALNKLLGQTEPVVIPSGDLIQRNVSGIVLSVTRDISIQGRLKLCEALETEYVAFFRLMKCAVNIDAKELEFSRQIAQKNCPNLDTLSMVQ